MATEGDLPTAYDIPGIARVYGGRPLLVLCRSLQMGTSFGRWFALRYLDSLNERAADMFEMELLPRISRANDLSLTQL
ncbi:putative aarF domain-containing protein kinase [Hordeum vulgare]|nr:putative aarF domain-containing protein kinase [Hordeum vulgare]